MYLQALKFWLAAEFPYPTPEQFERSNPKCYKDAFRKPVQEILDAWELEMERPSCLMCNRTVWSQYKHRCTCKFMIGMAACGAVVTASEPRGGSCDDVLLAQCTGVIDRLYANFCSLLDKGFMMQAEMAEKKHDCVTPTHRWNGQVSFTLDESKVNDKVAIFRVPIENQIKSVREFKILHKVVKVRLYYLLPLPYLCRSPTAILLVPSSSFARSCPTTKDPFGERGQVLSPRDAP